MAGGIGHATAPYHGDAVVAATRHRLAQVLRAESPGTRSWYIYFFLLPGVSEHLLLGRDSNGSGLSRLLQCKGQTCEAADRDARAMTEQGRLTCALNWYRAMLLADVRGWSQNIIRSVPTMYVWADQDSTIMGAGARACGDYVRSEYRFEILRGVSHWMLDDAPGAVSDLLLDWFAAHRSPQHSGG